jgi:MFS family permease
MTAALPRAFRWFWAGETVSGFGSWITMIALQVIVVDHLHAGTVGLDWLNASRWLPYLLFGLVLGALIDRVRRRPVMIGTDLVRAILLCAIPALWFADLLDLGVLVLLVARDC